MSAFLPVERAISFTAAMVAALRAGRKTVTRRRFASHLPMQERPFSYQYLGMEADTARLGRRTAGAAPPPERVVCPFGRPGDRLRVLEAPELLLEIVRVGAEQLQSITEAEARAEGVEPAPGAAGSARAAFQALIDSIYPGAWLRNEWVWVIGFRLVGPEEAAAPK
ncbi:ASCH domain-containing protein [Hymenobacter metallicola]|uniref:ASCH domain-containing protein n=1 Tax=Hymenobacter metallicola TaxID=2563114 RepID=A0A4Z0QFX8_9BACT|nr:hypothetical protein [Hymenobacter metallicola]TGE28655.1 hypothetical protein E5K02_04090 [Hymenobacter metallicola]